ncbi:MAG: hypothetical protein ACREFQ_10535, partial [Stellaceae bacterium]
IQLAPEALASPSLLARCLETVAASAVPGVFLFLGQQEALSLLEFRGSAWRPPWLFRVRAAAVRAEFAPAVQRLRLLVGDGRLGLILDIPESRGAEALRGFAGDLRPLQELAGVEGGVLGARIRDREAPLASEAITRALAEAGLAGFSYRADAVRRSSANFARLNGSYKTSGSYHPHSFDRRIPAPLLHPDCPIEIVGQNGEGLDTIADWACFWSARLDARQERLALMLDYKRREKYQLLFAGSPALGPFYHEYGVHLWPRPDPPLRATFVELGAFADTKRLERALAAAEGFVAGEGPRLCLRSPRQFLATAKEQAAAACRSSAQTLVEHQVSEHRYLGDIKSADPDSPIEAA